MRILAISGSLRASSSNTALLQTAVALAPQDVEVVLFDGLGDLPHFNPDLDGATAPQAVSVWRSKIRDADGVVFSVPEYAHGVPGVLKNGLDWVVGSGEFVGKPVTLFNASPRSTYAQASLRASLQHLRSGGMLVIFPAGEVSHFRWSDRTVTDGEWNTSASRMVGIADVPVIPLYVEGTNSLTFQLAGLAHSASQSRTDELIALASAHFLSGGRFRRCFGA